MGITERREREKEEIRKKILDAARELFATEGYERVTMRKIADAIEYSPTTIYHHFEDKDDLVRALCLADFAELLAAMQHAPAPDDPVEAIRQLGRAYVAFALQNPNQYRFMFMTPVAKDEITETSPGQQSFGHLLEAVKPGRCRRPAAPDRPSPRRAGPLDERARRGLRAHHPARRLLAARPRRPRPRRPGDGQRPPRPPRRPVEGLTPWSRSRARTSSTTGSGS